MVSFWILTFAYAFFSAVLSSYIADKRGRSSTFWFGIGFFVWFMPFVLFFLPPLHDSQSKRQLATADISLVPGSSIDFQSVSLKGTHFKDLENKEWYFLDNSHTQQGPMSYSTLKQIWKEEKMHTSSFVWADPMENWMKVHEVHCLISSLDA